MLDFILSLLEAAYSGKVSLDTRKIDKHIEGLKQYDWFLQINENERYRRLFNVNRNVRLYLQSERRVKRLTHNPKAQEQFKQLLEKQARKTE
ncbi:hypothetical protein [Bacillus suaedaesalsae]|uniref:Uncharacterized protein n=1 Tax=Bacillus suaedaesalsae TaxID=2810349 RepID=A0ABS2DJ10_9BACI|nr:hypothetical protein [Bacillus suaedaesalsae]MBM6617985.1 hypothetical protein [Bacillus suaedaesalsae]